MTALDEIQEASRELAALSRQQRPPSREEVLEALEKLREKISAFIIKVSQLYDSAILLSSYFKSAALAAEVWKDLHENFSFVLEVLERQPKLEPGLDQLIEDSRNVVRNIVEKADQKYRSYAEIAETQADLADCDAIAREGFAILDAEEARIER